MQSLSETTGWRSSRSHANSIDTGSQSGETHVPRIFENSTTSSAPFTCRRIVSSPRDSSKASATLPSEYLIVIFCDPLFGELRCQVLILRRPQIKRKCLEYR